ncbi:MAG: hypothetical protein HC819_05690 [Cyclobacteriaceae bacterium]|nr:hypothetical protein [Cyclobacteriaceae bacterium]
MIVALGNLYYFPLKLYVFVASYFYFRKLSVVGRENIPRQGPLIYAINHQNALLDALLLSVLTWRNPHFLTRSDVFNNRYVNQFLRGLKMLPIYRIRDGFGDVKKMMPSFGDQRHTDQRRCCGHIPGRESQPAIQNQTAEKGLARIAFMSEEATNFTLNVQVVPIGIQYESYFGTKGRTLVNIGKPIAVADFREAYLHDPGKASDQLLAAISASLKSLVLHIQSQEQYDRVLEQYHQRRVHKINLCEQLGADQALISAIEGGEEFTGQADQPGMAWRFLDGGIRLMRSIIGFVPGWCIDKIVSRTVKDEHFTGTMRFAYSIFLYPPILFLMYLCIKIIIGLF